MKHFNVVIIGAGPAGLKAAEVLGGADRQVLLLERNFEIGPKICAGGLTRKSVFYLKAPKRLLDFSYDKIDFFTPHIKTVIRLGEDFFYTVDRKKLGQWQLEKINLDFVEVKTNAHVKKIKEDKIELKGGEKFSFDYLIGADGSNSIVRRHLGIRNKKMGMAVQYILPRENHDCIQIHLNSKFFHSWYAWIFPHQKYISVGYGYPIGRFNSKKMENNFRKWANKNNINLSRGRREAFPINCDYKGFRFKNIFLAGDAAGLASGYTGEGIYQALVSGEEVANIIINKSYKPQKVKEILRERFFHHFFLRVVYYAGPLRNLIFDFVGICVKNKFLGKTLMRILS